MLVLAAKQLQRQEKVVRDNETLFAKVRQAGNKPANKNPRTIFARATSSTLQLQRILIYGI
jgi:hypothetical protein